MDEIKLVRSFGEEQDYFRARPSSCNNPRLKIAVTESRSTSRLVDTKRLRAQASRPQIAGAIHALAERAIKSGDIGKDLDPCDLLRALIGVSNVASGPDWQ
jgi:hypothetical protein